MNATAMNAVAALAIIAAAAAAPATAQTGRETFTAFAVDLGGMTRGSSTDTVVISIDRWSTEAERRRLVDALREKGPDGLRDAITDLKSLGRIRTAGNIGYELRYAHQVPTATGGRRIFIATDRPISFREAVRGGRSRDYPFTVVEMRLDAKGEGQGKLSVATRIIETGDGVELENWDSMPVQLTKIRSDKDKD
jgi:hypothetical protein